MNFTDQVILDGPRRTRDGYLAADARIARTGIQVYSGRECGRPELATVRVYRPEAEVFKDGSMASMAHRPVTVNHPSVMVDATNWREHAVGYTGDTITRDGGHIRVPLLLTDAKAISGVESGTRELSVGYTCDLEFRDGVTPEGAAYDAIQTNIKANHLAICSKARAGSECRIGDGDQGHSEKEAVVMATKTITFDGLPLEVTDAGEAAIIKLKGLLTDAEAKLVKIDAEAVAKDAAHTAALAAKDKELTDAKALIPDAKALDALAAGRAKLIADAKAMDATVVIDGKTDDEIRQAVVTKVLGDDKVTGKDATWFSPVFDALVVQGVGTKDATQSAKPGFTLTPVAVGDAKVAAFNDGVAAMSDAWRAKAA